MWIGKQSKDSHFATMKEINEVKTKLNELEESTKNLANYDDSDVRDRIRDLRDTINKISPEAISKLETDVDRLKRRMSAQNTVSIKSKTTSIKSGKNLQVYGNKRYITTMVGFFDYTTSQSKPADLNQIINYSLVNGTLDSVRLNTANFSYNPATKFGIITIDLVATNGVITFDFNLPKNAPVPMTDIEVAL